MIYCPNCVTNTLWHDLCPKCNRIDYEREKNDL